MHCLTYQLQWGRVSPCKVTWWLMLIWSSSGGHLDVIQLLVNAKADVDSQDNRKVSCLMAAFRKGHVKVVKWLVKYVMQFPSDQECMRFIATITDKVSQASVLSLCSLCVLNRVVFRVVKLMHSSLLFSQNPRSPFAFS